MDPFLLDKKNLLLIFDNALIVSCCQFRKSKKYRDMKLIIILPFLTIIATSYSQKKYPYDTDKTITIPKILEIPDKDSLGMGHIAFMPDGCTCYYLSETHGKMVIKCSHFENGAWSIGATCDFSNNRDVETPSISPDGKRLFFTEPGENFNSSKLYVLERKSKTWSEPKPIYFANDSGKYFDGSPTCALNGNLYFFSNRAGGWKIFCASLTNGKYSKPMMLKGFINSFNVAELYIAPDESYLLFGRYISDNNTGDIYVSFHENGSWTEPKSLGPKVNTPEYEGRPCLSPDGKYLFFTRGLPSKIYQIDLEPLLTHH
jgi:Tol biopolymer transport system component